MKTTSYEISKKLAEIGFKQSSTIGWFNSKCGGGGRFHVPDGIRDGYTLECYSFDLETILEALPKIVNGMPLKMRLDRSGHMGYSSGHAEEQQFICFKRKNESLADTAARLLILLHKKGLINFNEAKQ